jgi:predicted DNA-binding transcriptional regulator AlpA
MTVDEVIGELGVSRAAFYRWRRQGRGPATVRLPSGGLRVRRAALRAWVHRSEDTAKEDDEL